MPEADDGGADDGGKGEEAAARKTLKRLVKSGRKPSRKHQAEYSSGRDPKTLAETINADLIDHRGFRHEASVASLTARWDAIVGQRAAEHCLPESYTEGTLVIRAESTAWATQLRLLIPQITRNIVEEVGEGIVTRVTVLGPTARPRRGAWRVT